MHVHDDKIDYTAVFKEILTDVHNFHRIETPCYRCGYYNVTPVIARQSDIDKFNFMMNSLEKMIQRLQLDVHLVAELKAQVYFELAKRVKNDK